MVGDSSVLENATLGAEAFRGDQLLWNLVAGMVFEGELAELATRTRTPRGFGWVTPPARLAWRAAVLVGGPLLVLLGSALLGFLRRDRSRRVAA